MATIATLLLALLIPATATALTEPTGPNFRVNTVDDGGQGGPSVGAGSGGYVVVWIAPGGQNVFAQRLDGAGVRVGGELTVTSTPDVQDADVAADGLGNYIVTWTNLVQDGHFEGVFGQRLNAMGAPLGTEFQVNSYTTGMQQSSDVAADAAGNFAVVWESRPVLAGGGRSTQAAG